MNLKSETISILSSMVVSVSAMMASYVYRGVVATCPTPMVGGYAAIYDPEIQIIEPPLASAKLLLTTFDDMVLRAI